MSENLKIVMRNLKSGLESTKTRGDTVETMVRSCRLSLRLALRGMRFVPPWSSGYDDSLGRRKKEASGILTLGDTRFVSRAWDHPYCIRSGRRTVALVLEPYLGAFPPERHEELLTTQEHGIRAVVDRNFDRWYPPHTVAIVFRRLKEEWPQVLSLTKREHQDILWFYHAQVRDMVPWAMRHEEDRHIRDLQRQDQFLREASSI